MSGQLARIRVNLYSNFALMHISPGYIAQCLERLTADQQVPGSNPGVPYAAVPAAIMPHLTGLPLSAMAPGPLRPAPRAPALLAHAPMPPGPLPAPPSPQPLPPGPPCQPMASTLRHRGARMRGCSSFALARHPLTLFVRRMAFQWHLVSMSYHLGT